MTYVREGNPSSERSRAEGEYRAGALAQRLASRTADDLGPNEHVIGALLAYVGST